MNRRPTSLAFAASSASTIFTAGLMEIAGYHVAGLGYSNPTPFDTPGEYSEQELKERLQRFSGLDPLVLICHTPPKDTALDRAGEGKHFGSDAIREFIEREQPRYFYCGHIHEAAGQHAIAGPDRGLERRKTRPVARLDAPGKMKIPVRDQK